jgi:hypothetical protein
MSARMDSEVLKYLDRLHREQIALGGIRALKERHSSDRLVSPFQGLFETTPESRALPGASSFRTESRATRFDAEKILQPRRLFLRVF